MKSFGLSVLLLKGNCLWRSLLGAIVFYTVLPVPSRWQLDLSRVARWAPLMGLLLGGLLGLFDAIFAKLGCPILTRSALLVAAWVGLTGGLHLDGTMDTADGLGVQGRDRQLSVMRDSRVGAFAVIAGGLVLLLKTAALSDVAAGRGWALLGAAGWGRWGQVAAIAFYPYLRTEGMGAIHKQTLRSPQDLLGGLALLLGLSVLQYQCGGRAGQLLGLMAGNATISLLTSWYLARRLGGQTGDTYGAVVEWTEALSLCWFASLL